MNAEILHGKQPMKLAAMEAHWETKAGAPMHLILWPDAKNERNAVEALTVPKLLSVLANYDPDTEVAGLKSVPPADRPPVLPAFLAFRAMVGLAFLFSAVAWHTYRPRAGRPPLLLKMLVFSIPLPYIANELGWTLAEIGRQPWIVYGVMRTADAVSPVAGSQVAISALAFIAVYTLLGAADFYLLAKYARRGPRESREAGY
jgi:cytochrome d ubiquinol oxidase subunit I